MIYLFKLFVKLQLKIKLLKSRIFYKFTLYKFSVARKIFQKFPRGSQKKFIACLRSREQHRDDKWFVVVHKKDKETIFIPTAATTHLVSNFCHFLVDIFDNTIKRGYITV